MTSELRHALRSLWRSPGYALACVAVLALGIGAGAAIFSVAYAVILRPLPYPEPDRLVFVWQDFPKSPDPLLRKFFASRKTYLEWQRQNTVFSASAAFSSAKLSESGVDRPQQVTAAYASASLFPMLGAQAAAGRLFGESEERPGADRVVVLSDSYFERRFRRNPAALGQTIVLGGVSYSVIGALPPRFHLPSAWEGEDQVTADVWLPLSRLWNKPEDDDANRLYVMARLKPGATLERARAEMAAIAGRIAAAEPKGNEGWTASVIPVAVEDVSPTLHRALWILLGAVGFLLLIGCANLANLNLARTAMRTRETAVRLALGATRSRIALRLLAEPLLVSAAGVAFGLLLAGWMIRLMVALEPAGLQRPELIEINLPVFAFAAVAGVVTMMLFGLAPAVAASRIELNAALKTGGGWGARSAGGWTARFLIAAEVALAITLLAGAGLMIRSFHRLTTTGLGFDTAPLTVGDVELPESRYPDGASRSRFFRGLIERARAIPGVTGVAVTDNIPLHSVSVLSFQIPGRPAEGKGMTVADIASGSPEYLPVMGVRLEAGRWFTDADVSVTERGKGGVILVNREFARVYFPGENPIGKRISKAEGDFEIAGVVSNYRPLGPELGNRAQIFLPDLRLVRGTLILRGSGPSPARVKSLVEAVRAVDPEIAALNVQPMDDYNGHWTSQRKFNTLLLSIFAALALVLAMTGIYGVMSNLIASRTREIGIRMAIGATPARIARMTLAQSMTPVAIGTAAGIAGSLALSRFVEALLFEVSPRDPVSLAGAAAAILLVAPLAVYGPVRRATRVECAAALREE